MNQKMKSQYMSLYSFSSEWNVKWRVTDKKEGKEEEDRCKDAIELIEQVSFMLSIPFYSPDENNSSSNL